MSRLTTRKMAEWLKPLITSGAMVVPGRVPNMPNRVIGITKGSGPGLIMDGLYDVIGFSITCRGGENNLEDAEFIAGEIDDIFLGKHPTTRTENFIIGSGATSVFINGMGRVGGEPIQLSTPDSQSRWSFTCNYFAYVSTNVGTVYNG
jgi:hypothetical protein